MNYLETNLEKHRKTLPANLFPVHESQMQYRV